MEDGRFPAVFWRLCLWLGRLVCLSMTERMYICKERFGADTGEDCLGSEKVCLFGSIRKVV